MLKHLLVELNFRPCPLTRKVRTKAELSVAKPIRTVTTYNKTSGFRVGKSTCDLSHWSMPDLKKLYLLRKFPVYP